MKREIIQLSLKQLLLAYALVLALSQVARLFGFDQVKSIIISCLRMTIQLILMGFVLAYLLNSQSILLSLAILVLMFGFAIYTVIKNNQAILSKESKRAIALSISLGTGFTLFFFMIFVIGKKPWYEASYFIPIAGMLIGNSMTGISLAINNLAKSMQTERGKITSYLMLGASPKAAIASILKTSFERALMPSLSSMLGMGIVFLPGMMTGQILSGISPQIAIVYQIAIMLGILASCSLCILILLKLAVKTYFNQDAQLK